MEIKKKAFIALILSIVLLFTACSAPLVESKKAEDEEFLFKADEAMSVSQVQDLVQSYDWGPDIEVLNVQTKVISEEYYQELAYNSIGNFFFDYSADELLTLEGEAWFFSIGEGGTVDIDIVDRAQMLAEYDLSRLPVRQNNTLRNFLIGGAVILVCATLSVVGTPVVACIALSALKASVTYACVGAAVNAAATAITYRVSEGTWEDAGEEVLESASQGFMMGAIVGAVAGTAQGLLNPTACFTAGTLVLLADGSAIPIEEVQVGMKVVSAFADNPARIVPSSVVNTFVNDASALYIVSSGDSELEATAEHPFFVVDKGWTATQDLTPGDKLVNYTGEEVVIGGVTPRENPCTVYNLEIENTHTYYVGDESNQFVLVHNRCNLNSKYANKTYYFKEGSPQATKYPDGVRFTYDGYADFNPYANYKYIAEELPSQTALKSGTCLSGNYARDAAMANKAFGFSQTPVGYTWHHVEDMRTLLLVPQDLHSVASGGVAHSGGASLITTVLRGG